MKYIGESNGQLRFTSLASMEENLEIDNSSNADVELRGSFAADSKLKCSGLSNSTFFVSENVSINGNVELYNDSINLFCVKNCNIPNGVIIKNISKLGAFDLDGGGNGFVEFEPDTKFVVENSGSTPFYNWDNLRLSNGRINMSGDGSGFILIGTFGGLLNIIENGDFLLELKSQRNTWAGETIRFTGYSVGAKPTSRYCFIGTDSIGSYLDIESCVYLNLYGKFDDNMQIRIDGSSSLGQIGLYGHYSGLVSVHMNCANHGASIVSYNDKLEDLTYNTRSSVKLYIKSGVDFGKNIVVNNYSKCAININSGIKIGDNVVINVREDYPSDINITVDIPAGTTVSY